MSEYVRARPSVTLMNIKQLIASKKSRAVAASVLASQVQAALRAAAVGHVGFMPLWAQEVGTSHALNSAIGLVIAPNGVAWPALASPPCLAAQGKLCTAAF